MVWAETAVVVAEPGVFQAGWAHPEPAHALPADEEAAASPRQLLHPPLFAPLVLEPHLQHIVL